MFINVSFSLNGEALLMATDEPDALAPRPGNTAFVSTGGPTNIAPQLPGLEDNEEFSCDFGTCPQTFRRKKDLERHQNSLHGPRARCPMDGCNQWFWEGRSDILNTHLRKHHGMIPDTLKSELSDGEGL